VLDYVVELIDNEENDVKTKKIDHFFFAIGVLKYKLEKIRHTLPLTQFAFEAG
jgi:hypothetical protein